MALRRGSGIKQDVLENIREKILFLDMEPGSTISDTALAQELEVSRTPIRESLIILQHESLVDIYPQSGTYVSRIDFERVKECFRIMYIEELWVMRYIKEHGVDYRPPLEKYFVLQKYAIAEKNKEDFIWNNIDIYLELLKKIGHEAAWPILEKMYQYVIRSYVLCLKGEEFAENFLQYRKEFLFEKAILDDHEQAEKSLQVMQDYLFDVLEKTRNKFPDYYK